jgi:hypothetical protein
MSSAARRIAKSRITAREGVADCRISTKIVGPVRRAVWSRVIYDSYPSVEGISYPSSITNHECVALYERGAHALPSRTIFNRGTVRRIRSWRRWEIGLASEDML